MKPFEAGAMVGLFVSGLVAILVLGVVFLTSRQCSEACVEACVPKCAEICREAIEQSLSNAGR